MDTLNKKIASFYKLLANRNRFLNKEVQRLHFFGSADYAIRLWPGFNRGEVVMARWGQCGFNHVINEWGDSVKI